MAIKFSAHPKSALKNYHNVPSGIFRRCNHCGAKFYFHKSGKYHVCPNCGYGFRVTARQHLRMLTKDFTEWDADLTTSDPLSFPGYQEKVKKAQSVTKLKDAVLTGKAKINGHAAALGIMDPLFIMGSLGTATGERITRMFEKATKEKLPVIMYTASGGARMQEGIDSLMQMAKISQAVNDHRAAGLAYVVVLMDPTTGGVTASFASQADVILAEPKALVGFAGRRVIEQTINKKLPENFQSAENAFKNGFVDAIVPRAQQVAVLSQLLAIFEGQKWGGQTNEE
ncbi:acetyl-CoA carboxylase carboxyltransferase subunit beta [Lactobacillus sp. ESL0791]|uniref:acetyl-CoA carboxylase carboxyltransferase subunit beta n=1 Tax=Lactobacillus sp. ESL0791 TaxID=2983234 RepID=UPI0023F76A16|nr:acetyl-CoA carboxylase carboxyltransferase subunit beta [Lactobacillus sp. ESL0791]MDF7639530.1 acetyl-CoA carboxylase carboxyltransferase subunit beta [Lactobacillus sp. ESL0791]